MFLAQKEFIGRDGFVLTDEMKTLIAAHACTLLLGWNDLRPFRHAAAVSDFAFGAIWQRTESGQWMRCAERKVHTREGQSRPCQIQADALKNVAEWLERYRKLWDERLDRLGEYLKEIQKKDREKDK